MVRVFFLGGGRKHWDGEGGGDDESCGDGGRCDTVGDVELKWGGSNGVS